MMNSQTRYQRMCHTLINTPVYMISSKVVPESVELFTLRKIEVISKNPLLISLLIDICVELKENV
jgi:hypothetical protein